MSTRADVFSPRRTVTILIVLIFMAELVSMGVLFVLQLPNYVVATFLDAAIMSMLILPALYLLHLKPQLQYLEERGRAVAALRASEQLLKRVMELLPVGVWLIDRRGMIMQGNPASRTIWAGARYVGVDQYGEFKGWWPDSGQPIRPEEWAAVRAIGQGEVVLNEEVNIEAFDGTRKVILNSAVPILDNQGSPQGAVIVNQDITQLRTMQRTLIETNELLEQIFASVATSIAYLDRGFNFIRVNDAFAETANHPMDYFGGRNLFDLFPHEKFQIIFEHVVETGEAYSAVEDVIEFPNHPERGVTYWDWSLQPVKGSNGQVDGLVLTIVEVTERRNSRDQLARQNQELRALSKAERRQRQFAETLSALAQALTRSLDLDQVTNTLLDYLQLVVPSDCASISLLEGEAHLTVRVLRGYGEWADHASLPALPLDGALGWRLTSVRDSFTLPEPDANPPANDGEPAWHWLIVPLVASNKVIGHAFLGRAGGRPFDPKLNQRAEAMVSQGAATIQNAWLFEQVRSGSERLQALTRKLVEIQENERYLIARELHDEAGQALSSLKLSLGRLQQDPDCPELVIHRLEDLKDVTDGVLEELHRLAVDLRPIALDHLGLVAALEQHALDLGSDSLAIQFKARGFGDARLPRDVEISLYRIGQEALANVVRHAQAHNIGILLEQADGRVKLFIEDDGVGFDPLKPEHQYRLGLIGMRERAEMFDGMLTIESQPGKGTSIIVEVPYAHETADRR